MKSLIINPLPIFDDNYVWLIEDHQTNLAVCVDPGDAFPVISYLKQHALTLEAILITHHHDDHIGGIALLLEAYPECKIYAPNDDEITNVTVRVHDNEIVKLKTNNLYVDKESTLYAKHTEII